MASSKSYQPVCSAVAVILILGYCGAAWSVEFAGGTGEPNDPYQIATAEQLIAIGSNTKLLDKHYVLVADIDLDPNLPGGQVFSRSPIARPSVGHGGISGRFEGAFDGADHIIRNLVIHTQSEKGAGLFGHVAPSGHIRNLGIDGVEIRRLSDGGPVFTAGAVAALNEAGTITACYARGIISGPRRIGWPAGMTDRAFDSRTDDRIGGLIGENVGLVSACYAIVDVDGDGVLGGLIGRSEGIVLRSFSSGSVVGGGWPGGLIGLSQAGTTLRSYWDMETSSMGVSAAGEGRTTAEMMSRQTYEPWTHSGLWTLDDDRDYPRLAWERAPGTLIGEFRYEGGSGTSGDPFEIRTVEQFMAIGYHPDDFDKHFALIADIDFDGVDCNEILSIGCEYRAFSGRFDGRSHRLSNLRIERPGRRGVGVFGVVGTPDVFPRHEEFRYGFDDEGWPHWSYGTSGYSGPAPAPRGTVRDLHLRDVTVAGGEYVGALIGLGHGTVVDCSMSGQVTGLSMVGGLAGRSLGGTMSGCRVDAQVSGEFAIGGLVGSTWRGDGLNLQDCRTGGSVTGQLHTGGLVGSSQSDVISRCAARCDVRGRSIAGGCLGHAIGSTVAMSHALGTVTAQGRVGGFVGETILATISDSYCRGDVTGEQSVGGFVGVYGLLDIARCYAAASVTASNPAVPFPSAGGFAGSFGPWLEPWDESVSTQPIGISKCFWDIDVSGMAEAFGNRPADPGTATGLTTAQMQTAAPFLAAAWDFGNTWMVCEGRDYPRLRWDGIECGE